MADQNEREPESIQHAAADREPGIASEPPAPFHPVATCLLAGLVAGLLAFGLGELSYDAFEAKRVLTKLDYGGSVMVSSVKTEQKAAVQNAALAFAGLGAMLGGCLGLAGGLVRKSRGSAGLGGVVGLIIGGAVGAGLPFLTFPAYFRAVEHLEVDPMIIGLGLHVVVWGLIGGAAGLAFGIGLGNPRRMLLYLVLGLVGAAVGAGLFEAMGGFLYPEALPEEPLALKWQPRFLARVLVSLAAAAAIGLSFPKIRHSAAN